MIIFTNRNSHSNIRESSVLNVKILKCIFTYSRRISHGNFLGWICFKYREISCALKILISLVSTTTFEILSLEIEIATCLGTIKYTNLVVVFRC